VTDKDEDSWRAWRAELERRGLENVKLKLMAAGVGRGALVRGFEEIPRDFVEDWVATEEQKLAKERRWTLCWAIVGGVAGRYRRADRSSRATAPTRIASSATAAEGSAC
jgi:hypothetical protein